MKLTHCYFTSPVPLASADGPVERMAVRVSSDYMGTWTLSLDHAARTVIVTCSGRVTHVPYEAVASFFYAPERLESDE